MSATARAERVFAVSDYGAVADDASYDNLAAFVAARNAAYEANGGIVYCRPGATYWFLSKETANNVLRGKPGVHFVGYGTTWQTDQTTVNPFLLMRPTETTTAEVTGDIAVGDLSFTVDDSSDFAVGDQVFFTYGDISYDLPEARDHGWATVDAIPDSTHLTLSVPAIVAVDVSATTNNKHIRRFADGIIENQGVEGITFVAPSNATTAIGVRWAFARNCWQENTSGVGLNIGLSVCQWSENIRIVNPRVTSPGTSGSGLSRALGSFAECQNIVVEGGSSEGMMQEVLRVEAASRNIAFNNHSIIIPPGRENNEGVFVIHIESEMRLRNLFVRGDGGSQLLFAYGGSGRGSLQIHNLTDLTQPRLARVESFLITGRLRIYDAGGTLITMDMNRTRWQTITVDLGSAHSNTDFDVDDNGERIRGLLLETRVYVSEGATGLTDVDWTRGAEGTPHELTFTAGEVDTDRHFTGTASVDETNHGGILHLFVTNTEDSGKKLVVTFTTVAFA